MTGYQKASVVAVMAEGLEILLERERTDRGVFMAIHPDGYVEISRHEWGGERDSTVLVDFEVNAGGDVLRKEREA